MFSSDGHQRQYHHLVYKLYMGGRTLQSQKLFVIIPRVARFTFDSNVHFPPDANLDLLTGYGKVLSDIASIPTTWNWNYASASANLTANVAYDMWLGNSTSATGSSSTSVFEV